eukprot:Filipodium_phascolosomae@DN7040_c0_g1_i1.p2
MYNGIGLQTPRGSGTNGYIQRNLCNLKARRKDFELKVLMDNSRAPKQRKIDPAIAKHAAKRAVEAAVLLLQVQLEEDNCSPEEIEEKTEELRARKLKEIDEQSPPPPQDKQETKSTVT